VKCNFKPSRCERPVLRSKIVVTLVFVRLG